MLNTNPRQGVLFGGLTLLMGLTRFHQLGDAHHLPDASLAVFFLAGAFASSLAIFPLLLLEAGVIDYLAMSVGGVSDGCFSPAYWFLIPTYASVWFGGRWLVTVQTIKWEMLIPAVTAFLLTATLAFLISNGSFYVLSGRFTDMSLLEYAARVAQYYPPYVLNAGLYVATAFLCLAIWQRAQNNRKTIAL